MGVDRSRAVAPERMSPVVLVVFCIGAYAPPFPGRFILSPSATLWVAGSAATVPLAFVRFSA
jgi:hypothetical protein